eukprot:4839923-Prymnesium_polylepis.1
MTGRVLGRRAWRSAGSRRHGGNARHEPGGAGHVYCAPFLCTHPAQVFRPGKERGVMEGSFA